MHHLHWNYFTFKVCYFEAEGQTFQTGSSLTVGNGRNIFECQKRSNLYVHHRCAYGWTFVFCCMVTCTSAAIQWYTMLVINTFNIGNPRNHDQPCRTPNHSLSQDFGIDGRESGKVMESNMESGGAIRLDQSGSQQTLSETATLEYCNSTEWAAKRICQPQIMIYQSNWS